MLLADVLSKVDYKRGAKTFIKEPTIVAVHNAVY